MFGLMFGLPSAILQSTPRGYTHPHLLNTGIDCSLVVMGVHIAMVLYVNTEVF